MAARYNPRKTNNIIRPRSLSLGALVSLHQCYSCEVFCDDSRALVYLIHDLFNWVLVLNTERFNWLWVGINPTSPTTDRLFQRLCRFVLLYICWCIVINNRYGLRVIDHTKYCIFLASHRYFIYWLKRQNGHPFYSTKIITIVFYRESNIHAYMTMTKVIP